MPSNFFICPQCNIKSTVKKIIANNYACTNTKCALNLRLLVHGELTTTGSLSKLYGWVLEPGTILNKKYEIVKLLGKGGYGATYLAKDKSMFDQLRAIKEIPRQYFDDEEDEFLTILNHHAIPNLFERFNTAKFHYSVMEYVEGESLEDKVRKRSAGLKESEVLFYAHQIFDVLKYIHSQKVVHRDLKPENILIKKDDSISLIDFGIAKKFRNGHGTRHLARAASYAYSSPEQYQAGKGFTDFKSDIYSFGAILYFLVTSVEPIDALSRNADKDVSPTPSTINTTISKKLEMVINKAMKMNKNDRFKNIFEMEKTLLGNRSAAIKRTCPKCRTEINPGDKFCANCGTATHPVTEKKNGEFVFRSNKKALTIKDLVEISYHHWEDAKWHLYRGDFERWLKTRNGGKQLAQKAASIRKNQTNKDLGLNQFLVSSNFGLPPMLKVEPEKIKLSKPPDSKKRIITITLQNIGKGFLHGSVNSIASWMTIPEAKFSCFSNGIVRLSFIIHQNLLHSKINETIIEIQSNGGKNKIPISISLDGNIVTTTNIEKSRSARLFNYIKPLFIFSVITLIIRYLGPTSSLTISRPEVIVAMGLFFGVMNMTYGKIGFILGLFIGASAGACLNILSYFTYFFIDTNIVNPVIELISSDPSIKINYLGWGLLGFYSGSSFLYFRGRKKRKLKV